MKDNKTNINKLVFESLNTASPANKLAAYGTTTGLVGGLAYMGSKAAKAVSTGVKGIQQAQQAKLNLAG